MPAGGTPFDCLHFWHNRHLKSRAFWKSWVQGFGLGFRVRGLGLGTRSYSLGLTTPVSLSEDAMRIPKGSGF